MGSLHRRPAADNRGGLVDVRALLDDYVKARDDLAASEPGEDAWHKAWEDEKLSRQLVGEDMPRERREESNRRIDEHYERYQVPVERAIGRMRTAALLLFGLDPYGRFDRPRVVSVDGTLLVVTDRAEDPQNRGLVVAEADDVLVIPDGPVPAEPGPTPKRRRKAKAGR